MFQATMNFLEDNRCTQKQNQDIFLLYIHVGLYMCIYSFSFHSKQMPMYGGCLFFFLVTLFLPSDSCVEYDDIFMSVHLGETFRGSSPIPTRLFEIALCQFQVTPIKLASGFHLV